MNRRQFKEFLKDLESEYGDVIYNTEMRWLSKGAMLKRVYNLKNNIKLEFILEMKEYPFPQFEDNEWMCDFAFFVDITQHLNDLNMQLQGKKNNLYIVWLIKLTLLKTNLKFGINTFYQTTPNILHT